MRKNNLIFLSAWVLMTVFLSSCKKDNFDHSNISGFQIKGWKIDSINFSHNWISPTDADFLNLKTGYILGTNGDLLKTTDSAISWEYSHIEKDSSGIMTSTLSFINDSTGFIYGTWNVLNGDFYGVLYKTVDGGSHWTKHYYNNAYHLHSMKFFDKNNGIALNWINSGSYVVTTNNGGSSWEVADLDLDPSQNRLFFSGDICFATGKDQKIFKSVDHGKTWITIQTPVNNSSTYIGGFYFINENIGFLNKGNVRYKTTDGGINWNKTSSSFPTFRTPASPFEYFHFCNSNEGLIFHDSVAYIGGDFPSFIGTYTYTTTDCGKSWIKSDLQKQLSLGLIIFVSDSFAYCIGYKYIYKLQKK